MADQPSSSAGTAGNDRLRTLDSLETNPPDAAPTKESRRLTEAAQTTKKELTEVSAAEKERNLGI